MSAMISDIVNRGNSDSYLSIDDMSVSQTLKKVLAVALIIIGAMITLTLAGLVATNVLLLSTPLMVGLYVGGHVLGLLSCLGGIYILDTAEQQPSSEQEWLPNAPGGPQDL